MDLGTSSSHDTWLAFHQTRLVEHVMGRVGYGLLAGTLIGLLVGAIGWYNGNAGWVVAAPCLGLLVLALFLLLGSAPQPLTPPDEDDS